MSTPVIHPSFAGGELSPSLWGRVDFNRFAIGLATARNGFINPRGGFYSRAGTAFVGFSKQTGRAYPPRLITFAFSLLQGICLEFGNLYMRVIVNGDYVTETATAIAGITKANPGVVHDVGHGYLSGDWVYLLVQGMTQLNGRILTVVKIDNDHFSLTDVYGTAIDTTAYGVFTSGTAARIYTLTTTYAEADLAWLKWTESADVMTLCCWNQDSNFEYAQRNLTRTADDNWSLTVITFASSIAAPATCTATANILAPGPTAAPKPTDYQYCATAVDIFTGDESQASPVADVPNSVDIALVAGSNTMSCATVAKASYYNWYKAPPAYNGSVPAGSLFGYIGTSYGPTFNDTNIIPDFAEVPPLHENPFAPGQATYVTITNQGDSLVTVTWAITIGTGATLGTGFDGYPVIVNGNLVAFVITNNGTGYSPGNVITFDGATFATGTAKAAAEPADGDSITLNGVTWTFKTTPSGSNETKLQGGADATMAQLASDLSGSHVAGLAVANYVFIGTGTVEIQYGTPGVGGNAYTTVSAQPNITMSAATLTGGSSGSGSAPSATLSVGPVSGTYPSLATYFQERRIFAASPNLPETYWMSQPGKFSNFDSRVPTVDSDAITGSPWSVEVNGIQFMLPMPGGLIALTGLEAWQLTGPGGSSLNPQPITPAGQEAQPQAFNGCHNHIPPIKIDYDVNFIQAKGSILRSFAYNFWSNIYTGTDLCYLSRHLFDNHQILEMAWSEEPNRLLWQVRDDGILTSMTYFKQQDVMAWARHDTYGLYKSVTAVTEPPVDAVYVAVQRFFAGGGAYTVERFDNRLWSQGETTWCVDAGLSTASNFVYPNATLGVSAGGSYGAGIPIGATGLVGGQGYSQQTTATINDPTGQNCIVTVQVQNGAVVAIQFAGGQNYTNPQIEFDDPTGSGSGASAVITLDNSATFHATGAFSAGDVGQAIRIGGGLAIVTAYNSADEVVASIVRPITTILAGTGGNPQPQPAVAGQWSIAPVSTTISGLWHLAGMGVTGIADGAPTGQLIVAADGTVTLPVAASLVTMGLAFTPQMQTLYLDAGQPTEQGRRKKIAAVTVRLDASYVPGIVSGSNQPDGSAQSPIAIQTAWGTPPAGQLSAAAISTANENEPPYGSAIAPLYTGDIRAPIAGGWDTRGQVAVQQNAPLPLNVIALVPEYLPGDDPEIAEPKAEGARKMTTWGPRMKAA